MSFIRSLLRPSLDFIVLGCLSLWALIAGARATLQPATPDRGVAVVFSPWTSAETAFALSVGAGARFVRFGGAAFVAITIPDDTGYSRRALAAGAWLVTDPKIVAACLRPFSATAAAQ